MGFALLVDPLAVGALVTTFGATIGALCGVLRAWMGHRARVRHDEEVTRRLVILVAGATPGQRAGLVRAVAELEGASPVGPAGGA